MDVDLATPDLLSLDTAIAVLGLAFAGYGGYLVFSQVGTQAGRSGWWMIGIGWLLVSPRLFLKLRVQPDAVEVGVVSGKRRIPFPEIERARTVEGRLSVRWLGVGASGYHTGIHHLTGEGRVKAYASRSKGPFVLLERVDADPVAVSPADPARLLEALDEAGVRTGPAEDA